MEEDRPRLFLTQDKADEEFYTSGQVTDCTKCGKTSIRVRHMPNIYHCIACNNSFYFNKEVDNVIR